MGKLFEERENEIQELIKKEYDKIGAQKKYDLGNLQINVRDLYEDNATMEILASYNKRHGADIQQELRAYLEPTTMEKLRTSIDGKDINKIKKQEQKEIEKTISSVAAGGVGIDANTKNEIEKNVEEEKENEQKQGEEINLQAEVLKAMYKTVLEEYYDLKINLQEGVKGQLETGDISVGDKQGTKLVLYEKYLKNIDQSYRAIAKTEIIRDDEEIKKFEEALAERTGKNEKAVLNKNEDNMQRVQKLYEKKNDISVDIAYLSSKANTMEADKFRAQMDQLQEEYKEVSAELYNIEPNPLDLQKSIEERAKDEEFRHRQVGEHYERKHEIQLGGKVSTIEEKNDAKLEKNVEETNEQMQEADLQIDKSADILLEEYYDAEERGNYVHAEELLESLETMADIKYEDVNTSRTDKQQEKTPDEIHDEEEKDRGNILNDPRLNATNDDIEVAKIEADRNDRTRRIKDVEEKLKVKRKTTDIKEHEYVPNRFNNRKGY